MSTKKKVVLNAGWNWAGMAVSMAAGFVTAPFLVRRLGETNYGLWIVIASFTSYFGMLDLGVRGAVGRQIAYHRARGDQRGVNGVLGTSLAILGAAGFIALLASLGVALVITRLFEIPQDQVTASRLALILVGVNLLLWLPLNVFDATLWAYQRFDLLNVIDITAVALRTAFTFALIGRGHGLVTLALLNLISLAGAQAVKGGVSFWLDPGLRADSGDLRRSAARELMGYGIWYFLISASRTLTTQASSLVIGARLGIGLVTPYSIAMRLIGAAGALIVAGTGVLTPIATAMHAEGDRDRQRWLMIEGGKCCLALSLYFVIFLVVLGRPLIALWMGPNLPESALLLTILALGEALPMSQWITHGVILGMGRHRPLALANVAECAAAAALAMLLAGPFGLAGVCVAFAISGTLCRGVFQLVYGCRLVGMTPGRYLVQVVAPVIAVAVVPGMLLGLGLALAPSCDIPGFLALATAYSLAYGASCVLFLVGRDRMRLLRVSVVRKLSGAGYR
jgi:O-antigen/teichoic acid export membrane protein